MVLLWGSSRGAAADAGPAAQSLYAWTPKADSIGRSPGAPLPSVLEPPQRRGALRRSGPPHPKTPPTLSEQCAAGHILGRGPDGLRAISMAYFARPACV